MWKFNGGSDAPDYTAHMLSDRPEVNWMEIRLNTRYLWRSNHASPRFRGTLQQTQKARLTFEYPMPEAFAKS
jgi:hypothetical protein